MRAPRSVEMSHKAERHRHRRLPDCRQGGSPRTEELERDGGELRQRGLRRGGRAREFASIDRPPDPRRHEMPHPNSALKAPRFVFLGNVSCRVLPECQGQSRLNHGAAQIGCANPTPCHGASLAIQRDRRTGDLSAVHEFAQMLRSDLPAVPIAAPNAAAGLDGFRRIDAGQLHPNLPYQHGIATGDDGRPGEIGSRCRVP